MIKDEEEEEALDSIDALRAPTHVKLNPARRHTVFPIIEKKELHFQGAVRLHLSM